MSSPPWLVTMTFLMEGVLVMMVAYMGVAGNILSFIVLKNQKVQKTFHNLLILLNTFNMIYLLTSISMFSLPNLSTMFSGTYQNLSLPIVLPVAHIGMVGSIYSTLALSVERYLAVVHPITKYRHKYSSMHFILPVVLYSVLYNLPKFFELTTACPAATKQGITFNETSSSEDLQIVLNSSLAEGSCRYWERNLVPSPLRRSYWYLNIYLLWLNTILNIIIPIISLIVLNIGIMRMIEQHRNNVTDSCQVVTSRPSIGPRQETINWKREVVNARVSVYIAVILVCCHTIRIILNVWDIAQTFKEGQPKTFYWPLWVDLVTVISRLALTISCSLSFYIYYAQYRATKTIFRRKRKHFVNMETQ